MPYHDRNISSDFLQHCAGLAAMLSACLVLAATEPLAAQEAIAAQETIADKEDIAAAGFSPRQDSSSVNYAGRKPLSLNASVRSDTKIDFNASSELMAGPKWNTEIIGNAAGNIRTFDFNGDSFMDDPQSLCFGLANSWHYHADNGVRVNFGVGAMYESSRGGQAGYDRWTYREWEGAHSHDPWGSDIMTRSVDGHIDIGVPLSPDNHGRLAFVADYIFTDTDSWYGQSSWLCSAHSLTADLLYTGKFRESHSLKAGIGGFFVRDDILFDRIVRSEIPDPETGLPLSEYSSSSVDNLASLRIFGEYTFHAEDKLTATAGLKGEWYLEDGLRLSPLLDLKYHPFEKMVLCLRAERTLKYMEPLQGYPEVFLTGKRFSGDFEDHTLEDAWTFGGSLRWDLPVGASSSACISFGYFRTTYASQMIVDYEHIRNAISFYSLDGRRSFSNNFRADFHIEPFRRFTVTAMFRYTDPRVELEGRGLVVRPMTSLYRGELGLRYATRLEKWIFELSASVNGPCRVYDFMRTHRDAGGNLLYEEGYTQVYPGLDLEVTKRFRSVEIFAGGENLTGFRQKDILLGVRDSATGLVSPHQPSFDASAVWGPVLGARFYAGISFSLGGNDRR